ncbi:uncharacterized protein LOC130447247 [Diorhabda sublineata]|uniref:uncharacterized protein LOC130447247 n=1 Tax=Diorhabda sublineata TaxID=1163346 RepID=UPI0024E18785|nr:uncharacterized protein LOC130447247 [Diorhabda sublineata]
MKQFSSVSDPALSLNNNLEINDIVSSRFNPSGSTSYEKQDFNGNHRHFHKLIISPDVKFDFHSELKVIRSTMYEPVLDRCVTTTIIKPKRHSIDDVCIYDSTNKISQDSPPEKPSRRQNKFSKHIYSQKENEMSSSAKMLTANGDKTTIDIEQRNLDNTKNKKNDASVQTLHLVPYRLRFVPGTECDVKLSPSETNCALKLTCCCRMFSQWILSQVGLSIIVFTWALLGAYAFYKTEGPRELAQAGILAKIQKDLSVELATELKKNEDQPELWSSLIHTYFEKHEKVFLEAVGAGFGEGGGGNIWTYPGCVLFAVSLLTTLGFGAPVPRTPLGRGVAVLFAAIGIPLHFLLILNMGNLGSIRLQQLAYRNCLTEVPSTPKPKWLKFFPLLSVVCYYILGVILFGVVRQRQPIDCLMFPLDFTAAGGVATVEGKVRIFYALYLELAMTLAATIVSLLQASASRGIVDIGLKLGLLTNT